MEEHYSHVSSGGTDCGGFVPVGYIAVDFVELDIKEMMELGKKATRMSGGTNNNLMEDEVTRWGDLLINHTH